MHRRFGLTLALLLLGVATAWAQTCSQAVLNSEFMTDPTSRAYASCSGFPNGNDQCVLDKFNENCTDAACKVDQIVTREHFYDVIDNQELDTLLTASITDTTGAGKRVRMLMVAMYNTSFNMAVTETRQKLLDIFPAPSAPVTNAAIVALQQKNVPRSTIVCNRPGTLTDVSCGLRGQGCP